MGEGRVVAGVGDDADLALVLELLHGVGQRPVQEVLLVARVQVQDVDVVGAHPLQGELDAGADDGRRPVVVALELVAALAGEHVLVAAPGEVAADALLADAVAVGGVDEREALVEGPVEQARGVRLGHVGRADLGGAQAQDGDGQAGGAEGTRLHGAHSTTGRGNTCGGPSFL